MEIERVRSTAASQSLYELLAEYERSLPEDLRHHGTEREFDSAFLARLDGRYGGCVAVTLHEDTAIMKRLYVRPEHRGKGAARALALAAIGFARERACARMALDTDAQQLSAAYALYRSLGFTECEPYGPVDYATPTFMELQLR